MTTTHAIESISEDDETIRAQLEDAFLPALLPALAQATGDYSILRDDLRPGEVRPGVMQGGMNLEQQAAARQIALDAIKSLRDRGPSTEQRPIEEDVRRIFEWMTGSRAGDDYVELLVEELADTTEDLRAPKWRAPAGTDFNVLIIGAGMSGILAAIRLRQAGVPFVIIEKNEDYGGTWFENTYPGARVDVPNAFYSYSFAQKIDWPNFFSTQQTLLDYFRECADEHCLWDHVRFNTEVRSATFDDESCTWSVVVQPKDGAVETIVARAIISAVGQLNRPRMPDIEGMETFAGQSFHSAQWDHSVELAGKRVAVIGTGASAAQFVPEIAPEVARLSVFQRTAPWFMPIPNYHDETAPGLQWLFHHVPHYMHWYRFWLFWTMSDGLLQSAMADDSWQGGEKSVSAANDVLRTLLTAVLQGQYADRPDLIERIIPNYPPGAKRILLDNGSWSRALKRENVDLVTDRIDRIVPEGVVTVDGTLHEADVIVYGTGFQASRFLTPMKFTGRNGTDLSKQWESEARAYLGVAVPNFPNLFLMYGPNTNLVVNGSLIYISECQVQYIMECLRLLFENSHHALDCRQEVHDAYNQRIDADNRRRAWGVSKVNSWYKNERGHVTQNWPYNLVEYWKITREPDPADYVFL